MCICMLCRWAWPSNKGAAGGAEREGGFKTEEDATRQVLCSGTELATVQCV